MIRALFLPFLLLCTLFSYAQTGEITGIVLDEETNETLVGAVIMIEGTDKVVATDFDGIYKVNIAPGTYSLIMHFISYSDVRVENVVVKAGETTTVDIKVGTEENVLGEIVVQIEVDRTGEEILLADRRKSAEIVESIGSQKMVEQGVSDVETGVTKLAGISKVSSGGVFVRGLGDRYNNAYVNGLPIASPDPNNKVIDLNLFPTSMVRNINVTKVYQVDQFADVSGAGIDIITREGSDKDYISANIGVNYNTASTFKDFYLTRDGDMEYFGMTGAGRSEPTTKLQIARYVLSNNEKNPFTSGFGTEKFSAPLDNSFQVQLGKSWEGAKHKGGLIYSTAYRNSYRYDEGINNIYDNLQAPTSDLFQQRYRHTTNLTGLLGGYYEINENHKINANFIFLNGSENGYMISQGNTWEDDAPETMDQRFMRSRYTQSGMGDLQLLGTHRLSTSIGVTWGASYTKALTAEPDRRDIKAITEEGDTMFGIITPDQSDQKQRYFQHANEVETAGFVQGQWNIGEARTDKEDSRHRLVVGVQTKNKTRDMQQASYQLVMEDALFNGQPLELSAIDDYINDENYDAGLFSYEPIIRASDFMRADRLIMAGFSYFDYSPTQKWHILPGIRAEYTDQYIYYKRQSDGFQSPERVEPLSTVDVLPALNVKYNLTDSSIVRLAVSKTLVRPNFRELLPLVYYDQNLNATSGNPNLRNSTVYNVDVKYEYFPYFSDILAIGAFYKRVIDPIEQIRSGLNYISYFNVSQADIAGLEAEYSLRVQNYIASNSKFVNGFVVGGNVSYLYSKISLDLNAIAQNDPTTANTLANITYQKRQLQGASPLLINASITYDSIFIPKTSNTSISLVYNRFASRIYSAGTFGRGDIYEKGYGTLDFVFQNAWKSGLSVRFMVRNILNPAIERYQGPSFQNGSEVAGQSNVTTQSFTSGINFGLTIGYRIGMKDQKIDI